MRKVTYWSRLTTRPLSSSSPTPVLLSEENRGRLLFLFSPSKSVPNSCLCHDRTVSPLSPSSFMNLKIKLKFKATDIKNKFLNEKTLKILAISLATDLILRNQKLYSQTEKQARLESREYWNKTECHVVEKRHTMRSYWKTKSYNEDCFCGLASRLSQQNMKKSLAVSDPDSRLQTLLVFVRENRKFLFRKTSSNFDLVLH